MKVTKFDIEGPLLLEPKVFYDDRGLFFESYNELELAKAGITDKFVQDNESVSKKNVLRGMHFQAPPYAQGKLVHVVFGSVIDIVIDIREESPTFTKYIMLTLSADKKQLFWIPPGFAHGFLALEDNTIFRYKCTAPYNNASERGIIYNDSDIGIPWPGDNFIVSDKDLVLPALKISEKII